MEAFKSLLNSDLVETMINGNPEIAEIARVVREKLNNPQPSHDGEAEADDEGYESEEGGQEEGLEREVDLVVGGKPSGDGVPYSPTSTAPKAAEATTRLDRVARTLVF
eukprot:TRINITY_DN585_c0_g1_i1.p2 TRINITY_DN585_c0_g1~~TRINITY_DN585_c0_g1_i1.p2  ORF type:complete len:108 (-),score=27.25 TRINITY_DN585_c0_g1_i1:32-355(-)